MSIECLFQLRSLFFQEQFFLTIFFIRKCEAARLPLKMACAYHKFTAASLQPMTLDWFTVMVHACSFAAMHVQH